MEHFSRIADALKHIDAHLDEPLTLEGVAGLYHLSPYYFHRVFTMIVGKAFAAYVRDRRLERACALLCGTQDSLLSIALGCGFASAQSFSRGFRRYSGLTPSEYRRQGICPSQRSVDDMIVSFTNRLKGGMILNPRIITRPALTIVGVSGDGSKTGEVWQRYEEQAKRQPVKGELPGGGYEVRIVEPGGSTVHVGCRAKQAQQNYEALTLPASLYASFDVYVARGYMSENDAMIRWLADNSQTYAQRLMDGNPYVVEYYDERFSGEDEGSIMEIWVPIERL